MVKAIKRLALNKNGDITYCSVEPEMRGRGRCNHIAHQENNESVEHFIERISVLQTEIEENKEKEKASTDPSTKFMSRPSDENFEEDETKIYQKEDFKEISQEEIDALASKLDAIAGQKVTPDNFKQVISNLTPDKIGEITKIAFDAAPNFSLPISDEHYGDENIKNKLYFANLPAYGVAGNTASIAQMFDKVGEVHTLDDSVNIEHSYKEGLTPSEYFARQFGARDALINKGVSTSKPGHCIFEDSIVTIIDSNDSLNTGDNKIERKILWKELHVGDIFVDGSEVVEIQPWSKKPCYELQVNNADPIILSYDHLVFGEIIVNGKVVDNLEKSQESREYVGESDKKWICVEDIYEFSKLGAEIKLTDKSSKLMYIKPYKNLEPQNVRCISTNTGFYETNNLIHHNTARKLFYAMSDTQVVEDCGGPHIDAMHCRMPEGHVCQKCANATKGGKRIKSGDLIGGLISTNLSEGLTQLSMKQMHSIINTQELEVFRLVENRVEKEK